jgi:hypothetical protein
MNISRLAVIVATVASSATPLVAGCEAPGHLKVRPMSQTPDTTIEDGLGLWRIASPEGRVCIVALNRLAGDGGYGVHVERCDIETLTALKSWRPVGGGLELHPGKGGAPVGFRQTGPDHFEGVDYPYRMERTPAT